MDTKRLHDKIFKFFLKGQIRKLKNVLANIVVCITVLLGKLIMVNYWRSNKARVSNPIKSVRSVKQSVLNRPACFLNSIIKEKNLDTKNNHPNSHSCLVDNLTGSNELPWLL